MTLVGLVLAIWLMANVIQIDGLRPDLRFSRSRTSLNSDSVDDWHNIDPDDYADYFNKLRKCFQSKLKNHGQLVEVTGGIEGSFGTDAFHITALNFNTKQNNKIKKNMLFMIGLDSGNCNGNNDTIWDIRSKDQPQWKSLSEDDSSATLEKLKSLKWLSGTYKPKRVTGGAETAVKTRFASFPLKIVSYENTKSNPCFFYLTGGSYGARIYGCWVL